MIKARSCFKRMGGQDMEAQFGQKLGRGTPAIGLVVRNSCEDKLPFLLWNAVGNVSWARPSLRLNHRRDINFCEDFLELLGKGR